MAEKPVSWQGRTRAALVDADVYPKTENGLKAWIGVGGSPESVVRAARHGLGPWEVDVSWWLIAALRRLGLARGVAVCRRDGPGEARMVRI